MTPGWLLAAAGVGVVVGMAMAFYAPRIWVLATCLGAGAALAAATLVLIGHINVWEWQPGFIVCGEQVHLRMDGLSAFFLALVSLIGGVGAVYSLEYWNDQEHPRSARAGRLWWSALILCLGIVLTTLNGLHFLIAWELFTVSAYFLITLDRQYSEARAAGWLYLAASHVAMLSLFAFFGLLAAHTGSWEIGNLRGRPELAPLFWLVLLGFGLKAGLFPLHVWLPSAHANAPSHVSALLSGVTLKMGIFGLVRFTGWLDIPSSAGCVVIVLGVASAVLGVAFALGQHDFKRLLAYHSVENIGIILIGLGFAMLAVARGNAAWGRFALAGGLLHVWNHGLFKSLLFFGAGSVVHATGTRHMSALGGLWRLMPWTASLFTLGAIAISGLPPLNGFVSEWLVYLGLFGAASGPNQAAWVAVPAAILLGVTGALALACFSKVCGVVFLGAPRSNATLHAHECGAFMRIPMVLLGAACIGIGLAPAFFWPSVSRAMESWQPAWASAAAPPSLASLSQFHIALAILVMAAATWFWFRTKRTAPKRALTWDCGYVTPTARMQYTAGSYARIITEWFGWILRPKTHQDLPAAILPASACLEEHTPETVLEYGVQPAGGVVMRFVQAARRLQHGRVQAYLFYLLVGLAMLVIIVVESEK